MLFLKKKAHCDRVRPGSICSPAPDSAASQPDPVLAVSFQRDRYALERPVGNFRETDNYVVGVILQTRLGTIPRKTRVSQGETSADVSDAGNC